MLEVLLDSKIVYIVLCKCNVLLVVVDGIETRNISPTNRHLVSLCNIISFTSHLRCWSRGVFANRCRRYRTRSSWDETKVGNFQTPPLTFPDAKWTKSVTEQFRLPGWLAVLVNLIYFARSLLHPRQVSGQTFSSKSQSPLCSNSRRGMQTVHLTRFKSIS